jgi:hypothetical protein
MGAKRPTPVKGKTKPENAPRPAESQTGWAVGVMVTSLLAAAMVVAARSSSEPTVAGFADAQPAVVLDVDPIAEAQPVNTAVSKPPVTPPAGAGRETSRRAAVVTAAAAPKPTVAPVVAPTPVRTPRPEAVLAAAPAPPPVAPPVEQPAADAAVELSAVTLAGCLEQDDESFVLKNTSGEEAPRKRSWKMGFLKKSSADVEVIDAAHRLPLMTHVGQRVSLTGTLVDRELQAHRLETIAADCD